MAALRAPVNINLDEAYGPLNHKPFHIGIPTLLLPSVSRKFSFAKEWAEDPRNPEGQKGPYSSPLSRVWSHLSFVVNRRSNFEVPN